MGEKGPAMQLVQDLFDHGNGELVLDCDGVQRAGVDIEPLGAIVFLH
jgi:hypothetical protein